MIKNIYNDNLLRYPLTNNEISKVNEVWKLIDIINKPYIYVTEYRKYLIKKIRKYYTVEKFYEYEFIINKLFWNLRWLIFPLFINENFTENEYYTFIKNNYGNNNEIPKSLSLCESVSYNNEDDLDKKLKSAHEYLDIYYRSFINKLIIVDRDDKKIYYKKMDGSSNIFAKNYFNVYCMMILFDRKLYEKIMKNPYVIKNKEIELSNYYYQYDYGFPNLNFCKYQIGSVQSKLDRIKKMYYNKFNDFEFWYKIIL